jgi:quinol monooxygenase YgiN
MKQITCLLLLAASLLVKTSCAQNNNKNMEKKKDYSVEIIRYNIATDQQKNFEQAYTNAGKYLKASPYCLGYKVIHGKEEPNRYIVIIHWTSMDEHLNGFRKSADFMPFLNLVRPFYNNIDEMKHYETTSMEWVKE